MIETRSDIVVDANGRWSFRGEPISNASVLAYFKLNLRRGERGFYIVNEFGEKVEHSYVEAVRGFPLLAQNVTLLAGPPMGCTVTLETGEQLTASPADLVVIDERTVGIQLPDRGFPARLSGLAMAQLADHLDIREERYFLDYGAERIELARSSADDLFSD